MVPNRIEDIAAAIDQALVRIERQLESDRRSAARVAGPAAAEGAIRLKALADAADDLRTRLHAPMTSDATTVAEHDLDRWSDR